MAFIGGVATPVIVLTVSLERATASEAICHSLVKKKKGVLLWAL